METIVLSVKNKSKFNFLLQLLKEFDFVKINQRLSAEELEDLEDIKEYDSVKERNEEYISLEKYRRLRKTKKHA